MQKSVICIGAGPAGLTAAYELSLNGVQVLVLEADPQYVGGIARTHVYKGFRFDIGGHRFFSKSQEIENLWSEFLPNDFLIRPRSSQIYYRGNFFPYPLKPFITFNRLGPIETISCLYSYALARVSPIKNPSNFEEWMVNSFGKKLFRIFFKTYTEKVWGRTCTTISSDWAQQRVQDFSIASAVKEMITPGFLKSKSPKTLLSSFRYPRLGPGMLWEAVAEKVKNQGGKIEMGARVHSIRQKDSHWEVLWEKDGKTFSQACSDVISSMPMAQLSDVLHPVPKTRELAQKLEYRDFIIVALMFKSKVSFNDQWLYIHDERVKTCRVQNFKSWSPELVPDEESNCLGLEYFCNENDLFWSLTNEELIENAKKEAQILGLVNSSDIFDACVVRKKKAYPVYSPGYSKLLEEIKTDLSENYSSLHLAGRNGMHRYNNQDHAMMTGLLSARNIIHGESIFDPWKVNQDAEYLES